MEPTQVKNGLYLVEYKGHSVYIEDCNNFLRLKIQGSPRWLIWSNTLFVHGNKGGFDTSYHTKKEALEILPNILQTSY